MNNILWLTGVSASGKTTIAYTLKKLIGEHPPVIVIDADVARQLWPEIGLSEKDRGKNVRRLGQLAYMLAKQFNNVLIVVANIAPYKEDREENKRLLSTIGHYYEIYVDAPLDERIRRDPKGLYLKALKGEIKGLTGYDGVYEVPEKPFMVINTAENDPIDCAKDILRALDTRGDGDGKYYFWDLWAGY